MRKNEIVKAEMVKAVAELNSDMNDLTVDKITQQAKDPIETEPQMKLTAKDKAKMENCMYIEPKRRLPPLGKLAPHMESQHAYDWEYVKGIFENDIVIGEGIEFWYCKWPGDHDCLWSIPANTPVYVPRMIASHLEMKLMYHTFEFTPKSAQELQKDEFVEQFRVSKTKYRGKFRPIGAFR